MKQGLISTLMVLMLHFTCKAALKLTELEDEMIEHTLIFKARKVPLTNLECLQCYSGDETNDCMALTNISKIPTRICREGENFCMVQRIHSNGVLKTFDRYCAKECEPGCRDGAIYHECVSCCNHASLCNTDNGAERCMALLYNHMFKMSLLLLIIFSLL